MKKGEKTKKNNSKVMMIALFVFAIIFCALGFGLLKYSHNVDQEISISYNEKSDIDYKVYLKKNDFFETPYLEKNRTYIASLIDYILVDYDYTFDVDANVDGTYSYYIKGTISANKDDSEDAYWSKDYVLSEKITKEYDNTGEINIKSEVKVDYQQYNNLLNDFKSKYGVSMDGVLTTSLVIENNIENELIGRTVVKNSNVDLKVPLTSATIEIPVSTSEANNSGTIFNDTVQENVLFFTIMKYVGYACLVVATVLLILAIYAVIIMIKSESKYNKALRKILKTYDSIIVDTDAVPDLKHLNVVEVTSFNELIDAHGEVRRPINYTSTKAGAVFVLISNDIAYRFDLKKEAPRKRKAKE